MGADPNKGRSKSCDINFHRSEMAHNISANLVFAFVRFLTKMNGIYA